MEIEKFPLHDYASREEFAHANSIFSLDGGSYLVSFRRSALSLTSNPLRRSESVTWCGERTLPVKSPVDFPKFIPQEF